MSRLVLGLPSKGRLMEDTFAWFAERGLPVARTGAGREYAAAAEDDGVEVVLLSASEIPGALADGRIHLGVTGEDLIRETLPETRALAERLSPMGFGHADVVVAVPAFWIDVETMADLDDAAAQFRARNGHGLRVATKYVNLTRTFFHEKGVADYRLILSAGATEAAPKNQSAEAIVDITSSGETLRANHLRVLEDGLVLPSQACLWLSNAAEWDKPRRRAMLELADRIGVDLPD